MPLFGPLRDAYRAAEGSPDALHPREATEIGLEVRHSIDALEDRVLRFGLWLGLIRHFSWYAIPYLLIGAVVIVAGPVIPWSIGRLLNTIEGDGEMRSVVTTAAVLTVAVAMYTLAQWANSWRARLLVARIDLSMQRLIFRRLQRTPQSWLRLQGKSTTTFLVEHPQQLSELAFGVEFIIHSVLIVVLAVMLIVWFGLAGLGVLLAVAAGTAVSTWLMDRTAKAFQDYVNSDHRRATAVDVLVSAWQSVRRQHLEPAVTASLGGIRRDQRRILRRNAMRGGWSGMVARSLPQVIVWVAVATTVLAGSSWSVGEGIALLVLVRLLLRVVAENLLTYGALRFGWMMAHDVIALLTIAPVILDAKTDGRPRGTVSIEVGTSHVEIAPGQRIAVLARTGAETTRLLERIAGIPGDDDRWRFAHSGDVVLVARNQPCFDGAIAEVVTLWDRGVAGPQYVRATVLSDLITDLAARAGSDRAELSSTTERLSEGQLVRLSLAQALATEPDVLLLDDPFAPLDPLRARRIASTVLGGEPGLGTRIFATTRMELVDWADALLLISDTEVLKIHPGEVAVRHGDLCRILGEEMAGELGAALSMQQLAPPTVGASSEALRYGFPAGYVPAPLAAFEKPVARPQLLDFYRNAAGMFSPWAIVGVAALLLAGTGIEYLLAGVVDSGVNEPRVLWVLAALVVVGSVAAWTTDYLVRRAPIGAIDRVHTGLIHGLFSGRSDEQHSSVAGRLSRDFFQLEMRVPNMFAVFATMFASVGAAAVTVASSGWWAVPLLGVLAVISVQSYRRSRLAMVACVQTGAASRGPLLNFARNALEANGFKASPVLRRALSNRFDDLGSIRAAVIFRTTWVQLRTLLTVELLGLAVFMIALWSTVASRGTTIIASGVIVYAAFGLTQQASGLVQHLQNLDGIQLLIGRVADLFGVRTLPRRAALSRTVPRDIIDVTRGLLHPQESRQSDTALAAENLRIALPKGTPRPGALDLSLHAGSLTVVVGESGVGKSTLLRTLSGAQKAAQGNVLLNGSVPDVLGNATRAATRYVEAVLPPLPGTVGEFLEAVSPSADSLLSSLCVEAMIENVGRDREVAELDTAQGQLLNLARAFSDRPTVVFCDEATSALDTPSERRVLRALRTHAPSTLILAVLHRPDNQDLADRRIEITAAVETAA